MTFGGAPCFNIADSWNGPVFWDRSGVCIQRGSASREGLHPGSAFRGKTPPSDTTVYGQRAGGTHPTGMHSCLMSNLLYFDRSLIEFDWLSGQPLTLMDVYKKRFDWPPQEYVNLNERTDVSRGLVFVTGTSENHFP